MGRDFGDVHNTLGTLSVEKLSQSKRYACTISIDLPLLIVSTAESALVFSAYYEIRLFSPLLPTCHPACGLGLDFPPYDNRVFLESLRRLCMFFALHACGHAWSISFSCVDSVNSCFIRNRYISRTELSLVLLTLKSQTIHCRS